MSGRNSAPWYLAINVCILGIEVMILSVLIFDQRMKKKGAG